MATITGALRAVSAQETRSDSTTATGFVLPSGGRSSGHLHRCVEGLHGLAVLLGQPVDAQVEIDPRRRDGAVTGLGLDGLDRHAGFAESGEAGVAQLVAGAMDQTRPLTGGTEDLDDPLG